MAVDLRYQEQARAFITETIKQVIPEANVDGGSAINAVLARGASTIQAVLQQETDHLLTTRDLTDPEALPESDVDRILENLLTNRDGGEAAFGFVRAFYTDRSPRVFGRGLTATTEDGQLNFVTLTELRFDPESYFLDQQSGQFFLNIPMVAEEAGEEYNVDVGQIVEIVNDQSGALRVTNPDKFRAGKARQTNTEAVRKARRSVSTRTPLARDGTIFFYQELFGSKLRDILVIGNGDEEMIRDELYDLGEGNEPRFQIGVDTLDPVTREIQGQAQDVHVGGRTDVYAIFDTVNYIQLNVDIFADMTVDAPGSLAGAGTIVATFVVGTTGTVSASGKLILDLGESSEETVRYTSFSTPDSNTYTFTIDANDLPAFDHAAGATVKVVNNSELSIGPGADITVLPVFLVAEVRLLDPVTFQPIGDPLPESSADSPEPGWYIAKSNPFDIMSAKETKFLVIDEKRGFQGAEPLSNFPIAPEGTVVDEVIGSTTYSLYTNTAIDFTGYQGRQIEFTTTDVREVLEVRSPTEIIVDQITPAVPGGGVGFSIEAAVGEFNQFPIRVSYYTNTEIQEAQEFLDQDKKRSMSSDSLSRVFLPVFIDIADYAFRGDGTEAQVRESLIEVLKTSAGEAVGESEGAKFEYSDLVEAAYREGNANYVITPFEVRTRKLEVDGTFTTRYVNPGPDTVNELAVAATPPFVSFTNDGSVSVDIFTTVASGHVFTSFDLGRTIIIDDAVATENEGAFTITEIIATNMVRADRTFTTETGMDWSFGATFLETVRPSTVPEFTVPSEGRLYLGGFTSNQERVEYDRVIQNGSSYTFVLKTFEAIVFDHPVNEGLKVSKLDYLPENVITDGVITDERTYRPYLGDVVIRKLT